MKKTPCYRSRNPAVTQSGERDGKHEELPEYAILHKG